MYTVWDTLYKYIYTYRAFKRPLHAGPVDFLMPLQRYGRIEMAHAYIARPPCVILGLVLVALFDARKLAHTLEAQLFAQLVPILGRMLLAKMELQRVRSLAREIAQVATQIRTLNAALRILVVDEAAPPASLLAVRVDLLQCSHHCAALVAHETRVLLVHRVLVQLDVLDHVKHSAALVAAVRLIAVPLHVAAHARFAAKRLGALGPLTPPCVLGHVQRSLVAQQPILIFEQPAAAHERRLRRMDLGVPLEQDPEMRTPRLRERIYIMHETAHKNNNHINLTRPETPWCTIRTSTGRADRVACQSVVPTCICAKTTCRTGHTRRTHRWRSSATVWVVCPTGPD